MDELKEKIFKAKYETFEFVAADSFLVAGGFLVGTNLLNSSTSIPIGTILVVIGLFLGIRVLWKFSSDLKNTQIQVNQTISKLENTQIQVNQTISELENMLDTLEDTNEKVFGYNGNILSKSSAFNSLDEQISNLKKRMDEMEENIDDNRFWDFHNS